MIALAGGAGTLGRYALSGWVYRVLGDQFAYGTLAVNVVGCVAIGFLMQVGIGTDLVPRAWRLPLTVGFLGGFTTMSTFGYETLRYVEDGAWALAAANVVATLVLCLAATWLGLVSGRVVVGGA